MDLFIVSVTVGVAVAFLVRRCWQTVVRQQDASCAPGCSGCACTASSKPEGEKREGPPAGPKGADKTNG